MQEEKIMNGRYPICNHTVKEYTRDVKYLIRAITIAPIRCIPPVYLVEEYTADSMEQVDKWIINSRHSIVDVTILPVLKESGIRYSTDHINTIKRMEVERKEKEELQKLKEKYPEDGTGKTETE